jgi:transposase
MANLLLSMSKLHTLISLYVSGKPKRHIALSIGVSRNTVDNYLGFLKAEVGEDLSSLLSWDEEALYRLINHRTDPTTQQILNDLFPTYEQELSKVGMTRLILWERYCLKHSLAVSYSRFCHYLREWQSSQKVSMHLEHKAGDKLFIDFAGKKLFLTDPQTGEITWVEVFLAVLGCSQLTYCQAVYSQKKADFLLALANSLTFFGGVPQAIVPDNLKSAVTKTHPYEPDLNQSIEDFASHYQTVIYPARSRKPKDKALVERTVGILYSRVYAMLEGQVFFSLGSLNEAIFQKVNDHNLKPFQGRIDSRQNRFDELERITLTPLPTTRYELKHFKTAKVQQNCHVILGEDKHYYSVPFRYVGKYVKLSYTSESIEIYFEYKRIAIHARFRAKHQYTTLKEHLPEKHQWIMNWSPDFFTEQAQKVGENTLKAIEQLLCTRKYPEQAYKSCAGILALVKKKEIGKIRLEAACERALLYDFLSLKLILNILDRDLDRIIFQEEPIKDNIIPFHPNIRGAKNYQ